MFGRTISLTLQNKTINNLYYYTINIKNHEQNTKTNDDIIDLHVVIYSI